MCNELIEATICTIKVNEDHTFRNPLSLRGALSLSTSYLDTLTLLYFVDGKDIPGISEFFFYIHVSFGVVLSLLLIYKCKDNEDSLTHHTSCSFLLLLRQ